ncbi:hypothetical protein MRB53_001703 [Persea americana]|uniref:Uncharacterized protein n=1 Tax=Persea americana TaxID=3435 RepID=A0ACC2MTE9_PERAE|nr:hypothetical protein MRB53_001703 [Persea americana]
MADGTLDLGGSSGEMPETEKQRGLEEEEQGRQVLKRTRGRSDGWNCFPPFFRRAVGCRWMRRLEGRDEREVVRIVKAGLVLKIREDNDVNAPVLFSLF